MQKKESQKLHFKKRFCDHFGLGIEDWCYNKMICDIQKGKAKFVRRQTNRVTIYEFDNEFVGPFHVVYDKQRKSLVTVFPKELNV